MLLCDSKQIRSPEAMESASRVKALGQYPTPVWIAEAIVDRYFPDLGERDCVIEPACGPGGFLGAIPSSVTAIGVEIDGVVADKARKMTGRRVLEGDFQTIPLDIVPTAIIGNPPFNMKVVDGFLDRAHHLLPEGGRCGFILPAYAFQTAARVAGYADKWSLMQEMIPRNIYPGLSLPLVFAMFSKDRRKTMVGFAFYREAVDMQGLARPYREAVAAGAGPVWAVVVTEALRRLGGEADVQSLYAEIEGRRPTRTSFWKEQIRRTLRRYEERFMALGNGRYRLCAEH